MKTCPNCQRTYADDLEFCSYDATRLARVVMGNELQLAAGLARHFRIVRPLGTGGMGTVFLADQLSVGNRPVALKVLHRKLLDDPEFLLRFRNEAASTGRIHHQNVVTIYESGQAEDGTPYIAMEYLERGTLRHTLVSRGALPLPDSVEILQQAARGLNAAHRLGIVHRDLKPDNIFLTSDDEGRLVVKIVDFGIAKLRESATHTLTGMVLGTPAYMSYEQACGMKSDQLDARSDLYSLGIVVYEMLTGRVPFHSDTPLGYLRKHIVETPLPFGLAAPNLPIPPELEAAVMKALSKERDQRFPSVLDFAREVARAAAAAARDAAVPLVTTRVVTPPPEPPSPDPAKVEPRAPSLRSVGDMPPSPPDPSSSVVLSPPPARYEPRVPSLHSVEVGVSTPTPIPPVPAPSDPGVSSSDSLDAAAPTPAWQVPAPHAVRVASVPAPEVAAPAPGPAPEAPSITAPSQFHRRRLMVTSCASLLVAGLVLELFFAILGPGYRLMSRLLFARALGFGFGARLGLALVIGPLIDRFGKKRFLVTGCLIGAAGVLALPLCRSFGIFLVLLLAVVTGLADVAMEAAALTLIPDLYPKNRSSALSLASVSLIAGNFFGSWLVLLTLNNRVSISGVLFLFAVLATLVGVAALLQRFPEPAPTKPIVWKSAFSLMTKPAILFLAAMVCLSALLFHLTAGAVVQRMASYSIVPSYGFMRTFWVVMIVGLLIASAILRRVRGTKLLLACSAGVVAGLLAIAIAPGEGIAIPALLLCALCYGPMFPTLAGTASTYFPKVFATVLGILLAMQFVGQWAAEAVAIARVYYGDLFRSLMGILVAAAVLLLVTLVFFNRYERRKLMPSAQQN